MKRQDIILLVIAAMLVVLPMIFVKAPADGTQGFQGADSQAQVLVGKIAPDFKPWFKPLWTPPSGEIQSLLFALQAGIGCGFLGYYAGLRVGRERSREEHSDT